MRSERVEIGFAGETTTPSERSAKQRIGTWIRFGERMSAVSPLESLRIEVKLFARVSMHDYAYAKRKKKNNLLSKDLLK